MDKTCLRCWRGGGANVRRAELKVFAFPTFHSSLNPSGIRCRKYSEAVAVEGKEKNGTSIKLHAFSSYVAYRGRGYWDSHINQRAFLSEIAEELGIKKPADWINIKREDIIKRGGTRLFTRYPSLIDALVALYPETDWHTVLSPVLRCNGSRYWKKISNCLRALDEAEAKIGIKEPEDWYSVSLTDLKEVGFPTRFSRARLAELLGHKYPNHKWDVYLLRGKYAQQKRLERAVTSLFPDVEVKVNVRKEADLINPKTNLYFELDVYIPALKLAFEYQEKHHYGTSDFIFEPLAQQRERDDMKQILVKDKGITLITIPYWWDGKIGSLVATIKNVRPDLLKDKQVEGDSTTPIPDDPPPGWLDDIKPIDGIGYPTLACFFTRMPTDPANWWLFEKYDGVRGFWNPEKKAFYSRKGLPFVFPDKVLDAMPQDLFLDGELWFGRDSYQQAMQIGRRENVEEIDWSKFKFMVFDSPTHQGTYEERYKYLVEKLGDKKWEYLEVAPKVVCTDTAHLEKYYQDVIDQGGEGVILRDPEAPYQPGRCRGYLKHKKFRDAEAKVVKCLEHKQFECEMPNGIRFVAAPGTGEFSKKWALKEGDIVSFKHSGFLLASKKPKYPVIYRVRTDLTWEEVILNFKENKSMPSSLPFRRPSRNNRPRGYWRSLENRQQFLREIATEMGLDPLDPKTWQKITRTNIDNKGGSFLLVRYKTLKKVLENTFPEMNHTATYEWKPKLYWENTDNCRKFFEEYAAGKGLDPLSVDTWYATSLTDLRKKRGGKTLEARRGGLRKALREAFPELQFTKWIKETDG